MSELDAQWAQHAELVADHMARNLRKHPPVISPWLTPEEAAKYLSLQPRGLESMRRMGRGPKYSRVGHKIIRYKASWLDAWLEVHEERRAAT